MAKTKGEVSSKVKRALSAVRRAPRGSNGKLKSPALGKEVGAMLKAVRNDNRSAAIDYANNVLALARK
jgi:poly-gamma-glutamate capsule biosynthesis protein CapA/YwtB (metallophosphatase superfamily)